MDWQDSREIEVRGRAVRLAWRADVLSAASQRLGGALFEHVDRNFGQATAQSQLFRAFDAALIAASGLFDPAYYLSTNQDVARANADPLEHFLDYGGVEGRRPSPAFDGALYRASYEDVREAEVNPLVHYLKYGLVEGRTNGVPEVLPSLVGSIDPLSAAEFTAGSRLFGHSASRPRESCYAAVVELQTRVDDLEAEAQALRAEIKRRDADGNAFHGDSAAGGAVMRRNEAAPGQHVSGQDAPSDDASSQCEEGTSSPIGLSYADLHGDSCLVRGGDTSQIFLLTGRYPSVVRYPMSSTEEIHALGFDPQAVSEIPALCLNAIPAGRVRSAKGAEPHVVLISSAFAFGRSGQTIVLDALIGGSRRTTLVSLRSGSGLSDFKDRFGDSIVLPETALFYEEHAPQEFQENSLDGNTGLLNRFGGMLKSLDARVEALVERLSKADVSAVVACSGDHPDLPAGAALARRLGVPFFAYLFDDPIHQWIDERLEGPHARLMERHWVAETAAILTTNEELGRAVWSRNQDLGIRQPLIVRNPVGSGTSIRSAPGAPKADGEPWIIAYTGSVYHAQADAFRNLLAALDQLDDPWELHIASEQDAARIERNGIRSSAVRVLGTLTREESVALQRRADVLFLPLAFDAIPDVIRTSAPLKTGEYLASGQPILVHAPQDAWLSRFFRERGCGLVIDEPQPAQLAAALTQLRRDRNLRQKLFASQTKVAHEFKLSAAQQVFRTAIESALNKGNR